ncbi:MAG TPA: bifunctional 3,4-dihydroxy-2-butanone-4-phosphate synthase/GTP cyclohydrolase II [Bacteroidia bacterium]|jgi:3,4-dihydroxy 2-butanone 4-phosphate synthase/GTP cyclohydrolase II|nr:bifunctional 3,4-dihydroxy-2-butanone-4-phosphate synthase/GTP cyclohydrolase II [Bacteroidia bacterium]
MAHTLSAIEDAIEDIKKGKLVIVVDDEDRENEGDFITAARNITPEMVNFMLSHGRGVLCAPVEEDRCRALELEMMVSSNTSLHQTPFTVSVDLLGHGCTTGVSTHDRAKTLQALAKLSAKASDFARPGHVFPLRAMKGGVLRRAGHTEAAIDLARLAGFEPVGALIEVMNEDGSMSRMPQLIELAKKFDLKLISIKDLIEYRLRTETIIVRDIEVKMPTKFGNFNLIAYRQTTNDQEHLALVKGKWKAGDPVMVRMHSSCVTGDIFGSLRCDCGTQLQKAMEAIEKEGKGAIVYINQEGRGIGLLNKLRAYKLQEEGRDTVEANLELGFKMDERDYGVGAQILRDLGISKIRLMTNNPKKRAGLTGYNLEIVENVPLEVESNPHNHFYLQTKRDKMGHILSHLEEKKK